MESSGSGVVDFGRFLTGFFVVMGIGRFLFGNISGLKETQDWTDNVSALPALLYHSATIQAGAAVMSVVGGLLIYGTIISFTLFFQEENDF